MKRATVKLNEATVKQIIQWWIKAECREDGFLRSLLVTEVIVSGGAVTVYLEEPPAPAPTEPSNTEAKVAR